MDENLTNPFWRVTGFFVAFLLKILPLQYKINFPQHEYNPNRDLSRFNGQLYEIVSWEFNSIPLLGDQKVEMSLG